MKLLWEKAKKLAGGVAYIVKYVLSGKGNPFS
jgi:hypothetical protein